MNNLKAVIIKEQKNKVWICPKCKVELVKTKKSGNYKCPICKFLRCGITGQTIGRFGSS